MLIPTIVSFVTYAWFLDIELLKSFFKTFGEIFKVYSSCYEPVLMALDFALITAAIDGTETGPVY